VRLLFGRRVSPALRALNYTPEVEAFRAKAKRKACPRFRDLLENLGPAYGSVFTRIDCHPSYGVELVSQSDMFASEPAGRVIRRDSMPNPQDHKIERWQVLIAGAGTLGENELYGRSIIADRRLSGHYVGPDAMVMTFKSPASPESLYAYAFLCTGVGFRSVRATSYGTKVLRLRPEMLFDLPVPTPSASVLAKVAALIETAVVSRERYWETIRKTRGVMDALPDIKAANALFGERRARCMAQPPKGLDTLAAWHYASTGGALQYLSGKWHSRLSDVVTPEGLFNGPRFARTPCIPPFGVDFWSQRDVFLMRPVPRRIKHPGFNDRLLFVPDDALLICSLGQLEEGNLFGRVELAGCGASSAAITQHILRLFPAQGCSEWLYAFLSTKLGLALVRSCAIGTSVPTMHTGLLRKLPVPDLDSETLRLVRDGVRQAMEARIAATRAEYEAVQIIEREVLPEWLG